MERANAALKRAKRQQKIVLMSLLGLAPLVMAVINLVLGFYPRGLLALLSAVAIGSSAWASWRSQETRMFDRFAIAGLSLAVFNSMVVAGTFLDPRPTLFAVGGAAVLVVAFGPRMQREALISMLAVLLVAAAIDVSGVFKHLAASSETPLVRWVAITIASSLTMLALLFGMRNFQSRARLVEDALADAASANAQLSDALAKQQRMFAIVSHELRSPAAAIEMLIGDGEMSDELRYDLSSSSRHLLQVIDDLRFAANPEQTLQFEHKPFVLGEMIDDVVIQVGPLTTQFRLSLAVHVEPSIGVHGYVGDVFRLRTLLTNLLRNACYHSQASKLLLSVATEQVIDGKQTVVFTVEDDGVGIKPSLREQVFERFGRGDTAANGTGLGLYLVREWAGLMGGDVEYFDSSMGGAGFRLHVSLSIQSQPDIPSEHQLEVRATGVLTGCTVLLVEDDPLLRRLQRRMLEKTFGVDVVTSVSVRDALNCLVDCEPQLIITDYFMPEIDGIELIKRLRNQGSTTPIIGLTAATIGSERDQLLAAGADSFVAKPLNPTKFAEVVLMLHEQGRLAGPSRPDLGSGEDLHGS